MARGYDGSPRSPMKMIPGLVNIQKAIENGPVEIVDFPIKNGGSFHFAMLNYQRVTTPQLDRWKNTKGEK